MTGAVISPVGKMIMWTKYLSNIEGAWNKRYGATRIGKVEKFFQPNQNLPNPFRSLLPAELQKSDYRYYYRIVNYGVRL